MSENSNNGDVFCRMISGEIPYVKLWEDNDFMAILDGFPNTLGMTLVITKQHCDSYVFDMSDDKYAKLMIASRKVARILEKGLGIHRVAMVMEGLGVNHVHIKLYPLHGLKHKYHMKGSRKRESVKSYRGYLTTAMGPKADYEELKRLGERILKNAGEK